MHHNFIYILYISYMIVILSFMIVYYADKSSFVRCTREEVYTC